MQLGAKHTKALFVLPLLFLTMLPLHAQTPKYALVVSTQASRSAPNFLGSTSVLTGNAYVFTSPASAVNASPAGIVHVCYWLDRSATGTSDHCESGTPYDLKGTFTCATGTGTCAGAWNTSALPDGWHTLTQVVTLSAGGTETDTAKFRLYNGSLLSVGATYDDGSAVAGTVLLQSVGVTTTTTIASLPLAAGAVSYKLVLQANTIYNFAVLGADGTVLASFPFALPSILKVDPAALRTGVINMVFRRADQTLARVTPLVSFVF
jgi:hypothetical protein